ncbi:winged helix DNA-binding protein [Murinocardiopsis flavida]|uniref:Winged helix DNA-binding protein n=1 Tax=Murinocardiopsis flavida TaxID=645275 RepID=A0A2P8CPN3_9ACTN|nr:winged helix DNA-binding domain-containing protein [Murinocardiopsis flavida]PSK86910.1 winged helix DNA-binding protein [Murinocardiopsis flavida]
MAAEARTTLDRRALNRAVLARQLLLERSSMPVAAAVEHLGGLQAQTPHSWYAGLFGRLNGVTTEGIAARLSGRELVRIALMRSTIHLVTARDCHRLRPLVEPVHERSLAGNFGRNLSGVDRAELVAAGRALLEAEPLTFNALGGRLAETWPDNDAHSLSQAARTWIPLVQVPPRGLWGRSGPAAHVPAEHWLGRPDEDPFDLADLVRRYLGAFGPASVKDAQVWSGLTRLSAVFERLRPELAVFADENGRELFDLPEAPRPGADTPAPVRFLYDYDNLLLSHADRTRVQGDNRVARFFTKHGPVPGTVLIDGFTGAVWTVERARGTAVLNVITPDALLPARDADAVAAEGAALLRFIAPDAAHDVRFDVDVPVHPKRSGA